MRRKLRSQGGGLPFQGFGDLDKLIGGLGEGVFFGVEKALWNDDLRIKFPQNQTQSAQLLSTTSYDQPTETQTKPTKFPRMTVLSIQRICSWKEWI